MEGGQRPETVGTVRVTVEHLAALESRARGLNLLPRQSRRSVLAGRHGSRVRGRGLDFEEIRGYLPGDDVRTLDWKVTLRTGKPQVRAYTEERDRPALLVVDQRVSMFFGTRRAMKSVIAAEWAALASWMVLRAGDRVGAVVFNDRRIERIRPHRSRARVGAILGAIAAMNAELSADSQPGGDGQLDQALQGALQLAAHDHLVCVVSDFAGAGERTESLLRQLSRHNSVVGVLVFDPAAQELARGGRIVVSGGDLEIEVDLGKGAVRSPLEATFRGRLEGVGALLRKSGVPWMAMDTSGDTVDQFRHFLGRAAGQRR